MLDLVPIDAPNEITQSLADSFLLFLDAKPKTVETYTRALRQFFKYLSTSGTTRPGRQDVIAYKSFLLQTCKPSTVSGYLTAVKALFSWTEQEHIYPNIAAHVKGAKLDRNFKKDYLTASQTKTVLKSIDATTQLGTRDYALLCLMVTCGLRTIEVVRADVSDLRALGNDTVLYVQGKGHDEKTDFVKVPPQVEAALRAYLTTREAADGEPLFTSTSNNSKGQRMTTRSISGIVKHYLVSSGFNSDRLTAHSLRHTAVTLSLLSGRSLDETQQFARHSNIATTQIYNHALERAKNGCSAAISAALFD